MSPFYLVLTSASVGVLVSALITLFGQFLERRSRRKELLFSKAVEIALARTDLMKDYALKAKRGVWIHNPVYLAAVFYKDLELLLKSGQITQDTIIKNQKDAEKNLEDAKINEEIIL